MAWLDNRLWCHPKVTELSDRAFRLYVNALAYSSGMHTHGYLEAGQQKVLGGTKALRLELVNRGLWDVLPGDRIYIHDWEHHNAAYDRKRDYDRDRQRQLRAKAPERASRGPRLD